MAFFFFGEHFLHSLSNKSAKVCMRAYGEKIVPVANRFEYFWEIITRPGTFGGASAGRTRNA